MVSTTGASVSSRPHRRKLLPYLVASALPSHHWGEREFDSVVEVRWTD